MNINQAGTDDAWRKLQKLYLHWRRVVAKIPATAILAALVQDTLVKHDNIIVLFLLLVMLAKEQRPVQQSTFTDAFFDNSLLM